MLNKPVPAAGITLAALEERCEAAFRDAGIDKEPDFVVIRARKILPPAPLLPPPKAEVPGKRELRFCKGMSVYQAVLFSGGIGEMERADRVELLRDNKVTPFDFARSGYRPDDADLKPGDVVSVLRRKVPKAGPGL